MANIEVKDNEKFSINGVEYISIDGELFKAVDTEVEKLQSQIKEILERLDQSHMRPWYVPYIPQYPVWPPTEITYDWTPTITTTDVKIRGDLTGLKLNIGDDDGH